MDKGAKVKEIDVSGMTDEEKIKAWEEWVRKEVNAALDIYLPISKTGHVSVKYSPEVKEVLESGEVFSNKMMNAVLLSIIFEFERPIDVTKPRGRETEEETETEA